MHGETDCNVLGEIKTGTRNENCKISGQLASWFQTTLRLPIRMLLLSLAELKYLGRSPDPNRLI